ncbi:RsmE family RNA methyltransferase [Neolewinella lacunae]|uniref:Ribosomal RNA small subunit methyltransferase E n=1 Tax=Neolewinella lacunae TaxID=1517758 RepID=A0A923PQ35_9BACT|nr:RsmE family RNA methyltransferase [Neolewinella lacunae]MBC6996485.1 16S rRNA (uracil(1498)-N(3))-methyltransferase [Neolewinella lacunae]MDN3636638.1 RsmE family RNA methyltransferase [Neolewinella lacunae]
MQLFYDPELKAGIHTLRDEDARHAFQVLRKQKGDAIDLVDGRGGWYRGTVVSLTKREGLLDVAEVRRESSRTKHRLTLLVAPTKNIDRFEWILEKATEIGIDRIQPILTEHSERKQLRADRLERILESAMKQSLRAWLPQLEEMLPLGEALAQREAEEQGCFAYLGATAVPLLRDTTQAGRDVRVVIGPEGGFSPAEAALARELGYQWVSLGPQRLRTETAAIAAVHTIEQLNW